MDRSDEIRMALDAYHREIAKLNQNQAPGQIPLGLLALQQQALAQHQQNQQQNQHPLQGPPMGQQVIDVKALLCSFLCILNSVRFKCPSSKVCSLVLPFSGLVKKSDATKKWR